MKKAPPPTQPEQTLADIPKMLDELIDKTAEMLYSHYCNSINADAIMFSQTVANWSDLTATKKKAWRATAKALLASFKPFE